MSGDVKETVVTASLSDFGRHDVTISGSSYQSTYIDNRNLHPPRRIIIQRLAGPLKSIRYTHFHALLSSGFRKHPDVVLEYPHPTLERQMIDTLIAPRGNSPSIAIEFKYDRTIPSDRNLNMTNRAGAVFGDLFKLAHIPDRNRSE